MILVVASGSLEGDAAPFVSFATLLSFAGQLGWIPIVFRIEGI
jgi:hypothetical protein